MTSSDHPPVPEFPPPDNESRASATWERLPPLAKGMGAELPVLGNRRMLAGGSRRQARTQNLWVAMIRPGIRDWLPWAILTPLIFGLVKAAAHRPAALEIGVPVHLVCAIATVLLCQWWKQTVDRDWGSTRGCAGIADPLQRGAGGPGQELGFWPAGGLLTCSNGDI